MTEAELDRKSEVVRKAGFVADDAFPSLESGDEVTAGDAFSYSESDKVAAAADAFSHSDSSKGGVGGRLLGAILAGQLAVEGENPDLTEGPAVATFSDDGSGNGGLGGRFLGTLVGGQLHIEATPIPFIYGPFTLQHFCNVPRTWMDPASKDEGDISPAHQD
ncbi:hypothetical protein BYT27DRAFT_7258107 [Phlegmacium glaucopus]|nr:hypothetical protein BYT27DRAFT_7258105 [Phlegmacium glaucopus]KAF8805583.1 hypothetical protein BYT27DRAFT_7258107 [Phlegmacium glaucopus]